ncbi:MAG: AAA family ATPase [Granulosicoccaceae bacterium]
MSTQAQQALHNCLDSLSSLILGKETQLKLTVCCLLAGGHLLIEDLPGMGKTTLAHGLAKVFGLDYNRVQFTSDLLPADLLGANVFDAKQSSFHFHPGPVFSQVLLADELNRASPKSQSALLEVMEERQVSLDGKRHALPEPFLVIGTQNPQSQSGTYALPESQLDRFTMRLSLGYPDPKAERTLLMGNSGRAALSALTAQMTAQQLIVLQSNVPEVRVSNLLLDYLQRLIARTRDGQECSTGLSPRAALSLLNCAKAWAMIDSRDHVLPEDIQAVFAPVCGHRLVGREESDGDVLSRRLLSSVNVVA